MEYKKPTAEEIAAHKRKMLTEARTTELLDWLRGAHRCGGIGYDPLDNHSPYYLDIDEIKAELATRPHIPNKVESKELRRHRAGFRGHGKRMRFSRSGVI